MIKITQLIKESFVTYKLNFKKIFWIALPILILGIISEYYVSVFTTMIDNNDFSNISYLIMSIVIYTIAMLAVSLYFGPVINRAIQKKEDNGNFDSKSAYLFQKKNIFKWVMVNVWGMLYIVWFMLPYTIAAALVSMTLYFFGGSVILTIIISSLIGLVFAIGIILNISKFILYKNIFFSKDEVSARGAVKESVVFGKTKNGEVWMLILAMIILTIIMMITYFILGFFMGLISKSIPESVVYLENIVSTLISVVFFLPWMSIVVSKGYNLIKV